MIYRLAQINIARFRLPQEHPANADFMNALDRVNALAERQPGFVWRLVGAGNSAIDVRPFPDPQMAINMSVWRDIESLAAFVYRNEGHREIMRRRREWFEHMEIYMALWWIEEGALPTVEEGVARVEHLRKHGPTAHAFTFKTPFPPPGAEDIAPVLDECA